MKRRLTALMLLTTLCFSLCSCTRRGGESSVLNGTKTKYSETIAYATLANGGVEIREEGGNHTLNNRTASLQFGADTAELKGLTSLQTGESLLQNTFATTLTTSDGREGRLSGGTEAVQSGQYGIGHHRTDGAILLEKNPVQAEVLKEFDLTKGNGQDAFSTQNYQVTSSKSEMGLKISSEGGDRAQFGGRYLGISLGEYDHYYLSVTLRTEGISGLKCFFSTDTVSLEEDTSLGTLSLSSASGSEFVTLTAKVENRHWQGTLQTLLFRLPQGESGFVEISRVAVLGLKEERVENAADTLWTVYSDRIYFSQTLRIDPAAYTSCATVVSLQRAKCKEIIEEKDFVALKMIDGCLLGFVRPLSGGSLRVEETEDQVSLFFDWDLSVQTPTLSFRIYLNYTDDTKELMQLAAEERNPLTAEAFQLQDLELEGYDSKGGIYRLKQTGENPSVRIKENDRIVFLYLVPQQGTCWALYDEDGVRLPVFAGSTFPLCSAGKDLTVKLISQPAPETLPVPEFFPKSGLMKLSEKSTVLNGLCAQNTVIYTSEDGSYTVTLTATRLKDGVSTIYDVQYDFHARKQVSDLLNAFPFFSFGLTYGFDEYFYCNSENVTVTATAGQESVSYLGSMPYVGLSASTESAGWLVTKSSMTTGGESSTALLGLRYAEVSEGSPNCLYLSFDGGETEFIQGDTLTAQVVRLDGAADYETALKNLRDGGNFRLIQRESREDWETGVTVTGMEDTVILQLEGFDDYRFPSLFANGTPITPDYHVYVDENGYYGFAFSAARGTILTVED